MLHQPLPLKALLNPKRKFRIGAFPSKLIGHAREYSQALRKFPNWAAFAFNIYCIVN
jgi:hypothetical protein